MANNIPTHRYQFDNTGIDLTKPFTFKYGPNELKDGSKIVIVPMSPDGIQFSKPVKRTVVLIERVPESNYHWYEARIPSASSS